MRIVADLNVFISAALLPGSLPRQALDVAVAHHTLLISSAWVESLLRTLMRPKFDR